MPPTTDPPGTRPAQSTDSTHLVAGVAVSHPERMVFPDCGVTKGDLAAYYAAVAPLMLPHAADRPLALVRLPEGLGGARFFQKHAGKGFPAQMKTTAIAAESERAIFVNSAAGLVAGAQIGVVEYHMRGSRRDRPDRPDRLVLDLDPDEGLPFEAVRAAACDLRDRLSTLGLPAWAMVTGGKGIHVVTDLRRTADWPLVTQFARDFARFLASEQPDRFVAALPKAQRTGKIFIDWLRNEPQSTAVSPFSVRAHPNAPVAMPVSWTALESLRSAADFTLKNALARAAGVSPQRPGPVSLQ